MNKLTSIVVYCGSNMGKLEDYRRAATELATHLLERQITLVYGGGNVGLMGVMANTVLAGGGQVIGVIPYKLAELELAHECLSELHVVEDMHQRKAKMASLADGVIALPGGLGTMEELFEALTWTQLGFHSKPCGVLNVNDYYNHLLGFMDHMVEQQFVRKVHRDLLSVSEDPEQLVDQMAAMDIPDAGKWLDEEVNRKGSEQQA